MPNETASFNGTIDGVWLVPYTSSTQIAANQEAWIGTRSPARERSVSTEIFTLPQRRDEPSQDGVLHRARGTLTNGLLLSRNGLSGDQWHTRLENLIRDQRNYAFIYLVSARYFPFKIKIHSFTEEPRQAGGNAWTVDVSFREVD